MGFELLCGTLIALLLGLVICFGGYRLFLVLLPIWGFFFGFFLGAETLQVLFGTGFLASVTSWVVGFFVGAIFAVLSYLFYIVGVVLIAGALGYALGAGFMHLIGIDANILTFLVGVVVAIIVAGVTIFFNIQKYVIIIATAFGGAAVVVATLSLSAGQVALLSLRSNPVRAILDATSWLGVLVFLVLLVAGIVVQLRVNRSWEIEAYENRI